MSYREIGNNPAHPDGASPEELEYLLLHGSPLQDLSTSERKDSASSPVASHREEADEDTALDSDVQGALGLYAEATQDVATAGLELALGRHFACADYCNQAVEKAAQAVSLLHRGHRVTYDHDLRALGTTVGAPVAIQDEMAVLTPFHPAAFYAHASPEEADDLISAEQASEYIQIARRVLRWARGIIL